MFKALIKYRKIILLAPIDGKILFFFSLKKEKIGMKAGKTFVKMP